MDIYGSTRQKDKIKIFPNYFYYGTNTFVYDDEPFIEVVLEMVETPNL